MAIGYFEKRWGVVVAAFVLIAMVATGCAREAAQPGPQAGPTQQDEAAQQPQSVQLSMDQLIAAAKKEGKVTFYAAWPSNQEQALAKAFEAKYGIPVELFRAGGEQVAQKLDVEIRSGNIQADVLNHTERTYTLLLKQRGDLLQYKPQNASNFDPKDVDPDGYYTTSTISAAVIIYNTKLVKPEEAPKSFKELADPKWKNQSVTGSPLYGGTQLATVKGLLEMYGWDWLKAWKQNGVLTVQSWPEAENAVIAGERKVGLDHTVRLSQAIAAGQPLGVVYPEEGMILAEGTVSILKKAPHPNAAKLFVEFMLSEEGQKIYVQHGILSPRLGMPGPAHIKPIDQVKTYRINQAELLRDRDMIKQTWTDTMEG